MEPFIGQIMMFGGTFAPRGWALCNGQLLDITSHSALFSILGTTYGGDGVRTFALPDLRGRVPLHAGSGPDRDHRSLGQRGGQERVTLTVNQIPPHSHEVNCSPTQGTVGNPVNNYIGGDRVGADDLFNPGAGGKMNPGMIENTGGGQAHENMQPFLVVNFVIALQGIYPSRN